MLGDTGLAVLVCSFVCSAAGLTTNQLLGSLV